MYKIFGKTPFRRSKAVELHTDLDFFDAFDHHYTNEAEGEPTGLREKI